MTNINRRDALKMSTSFALAAATGGFSCIELANAGPIEVPTIDKLTVRVLVDSASDIFFKPQQAAGVTTEAGRSAVSTRPLHSEWGLALLLEPQRGDDRRTFLLGFWLDPRDHHREHGFAQGRSIKHRYVDYEPRPFRPLGWIAGISRQAPQGSACRTHNVCRRRGQFLPALRSGRPDRIE